MSDKPSLPSSIQVEKTGAPPIFSRWYYFGIQMATVLIFLSSAFLVWVFGFTFWTLLVALVRALHGTQGHSVVAPLFALITRQHGVLGIADGWPLDAALIMALISTWCCLYLAFDHLILWGNRAARRSLCKRLPEDSSEHFFVEMRSVRKPSIILPDLGVLTVTPNALQFEGERQRILLPRSAVGNTVVLRRSTADLAAAYVYLPLQENSGIVQLLARDDATRLSETVHDALRLESALRQWLAANIPSQESPGVT
jgi:hypothetical protein